MDKKKITNAQQIPILDIKEVRIIGKIIGTKDTLELSFNKKRFFEWINKYFQDSRSS